MILMDLKAHLAAVKTVSLAELTQRFNLDALTIRDMLNLLIHKGIICRRYKTSACGSACHKCELAAIEIYEWVTS